MNTLKAEEDLFKSLIPKIQKLVASYGSEIKIAKHKQSTSDYATEVDVAVEKLIVNEINAAFPNDQILAEEGHSDTVIPATRIWIIDPICGTNNLGRGMRNFCTNIALADNKVIVAACVIDHSQDDFFYSVGDNSIHSRNERTISSAKDRGTTIDIDLGALTKPGPQLISKYVRSVSRLLTETDYALISLNTSLGFAYVAVGKIDGFINVQSYPWDICAAAFLIQQSGGIITDLMGMPWSIHSEGAIAAVNPEIHQKLLSCYS